MKQKEALKLLATSFLRYGLKGFLHIASAYCNLKAEPLVMSSQPLIVQIEPTTYCNLKCLMCINPLSVRPKRHLSLAEFRKITNDIPFVRKISLVGSGEPLLNPQLFEMISFAKSKGISIGFATNGLLLNETICRRIVTTGVDWLNISIDSATKEGYESIRKGGIFSRLTTNIRLLLKLKGKYAYPDISIWFVILKENASELPSVIRLAKELGINRVYAQLGHDWGGTHIKPLLLYSLPENILILLKEAKREAKRIGVKFDYVNLPDYTSRRTCKWPWKECFITVDGYVTPCCIRGTNPEVVNFGNIFMTHFSQIWNSAAYQDFRKRLKSSLRQDFCAGCVSYYEKLKT